MARPNQPAANGGGGGNGTAGAPMNLSGLTGAVPSSMLSGAVAGLAIMLISGRSFSLSNAGIFLGVGAAANWGAKQVLGV